MSEMKNTMDETTGRLNMTEKKASDLEIQQ